MDDARREALSQPLVSRRQLIAGAIVAVVGIAGYLFVPAVHSAIDTAVDVLAHGDVAVVRDYLLSFGVWAPIVSFVLMMLQSLIAPLPAFVLTFANGLLFGWVLGALLSWSSAMAGAALCFWLARSLGRPAVERLAGGSHGLEVSDLFFERYGDRAVLIARLLPFVSFDVISYGAGLTSMDFWRFFVATGLGQLPATLVYSYLGENLTGSIRVVFFIFVFTTTALIVAATVRPHFMRRLRADVEQAPSAALADAAEPPSAEEPERRSAGRTGTIVRIAVSVALLGLIATRVDLGGIGAKLAHLQWPWMLAAAATVYAAIVLSSVKWGLLLRARGHALPLPRLTRHYLVGLFFNNFLPTSVGGDVVRAWDAGKDIGDMPEGAASVVAERLIASVGLALTAAIGLPFVDVGPQAYAAVAVVFVAGIGLAALFLVPTLSERIVRSAMGSRFEGVAGWVGRATAATGELLRSGRTVLAVGLLSIAFQVLVAAVNWCLFRALSAPVPLAACVVYTSIVSAVTMVPISISGHGVREAGYAYFFGLAGVAAATAVSASVLFFATVAVCTLPGALFFAVGRRNPT